MDCLIMTDLLSKAMRYYNQRRSNPNAEAITKAEKDDLLYLMADKLYDLELTVDEQKTKIEELECQGKDEIEAVIDSKDLLDQSDKSDLERNISNLNDKVLDLKEALQNIKNSIK